ncbi:MAG: hypothetical protein ACFFCW_25965 [Candidatus Hodarchaeota archaeon]
MSERNEEKGTKKKVEWKPDSKITMIIKKGDEWKPDEILKMKFQESVEKKKRNK